MHRNVNSYLKFALRGPHKSILFLFLPLNKVDYKPDSSALRAIPSVAAPAIDNVGPRPYHFCSGPTSFPTTWLLLQEDKKQNQNLQRHFQLC